MVAAVQKIREAPGEVVEIKFGRGGESARRKIAYI